MEQDSAASDQDLATPIFGAYRRGYDPEQVDRFVADQQRRLDESTRRASEAERKLAAAVGQLRELHRRVAVLESEERSSPQPQSLDTLGERVQRILQEAWEGAYALRQSAELDVAESRDKSAAQAEEILAGARRKAEAIEKETERRRGAYLERIEEDRTRAIAQMTYLSDQRKLAVNELLGVKALIETTLNEVNVKGEPAPLRVDVEPPVAPSKVIAEEAEQELVLENEAEPLQALLDAREESLPSTMPLHRLPPSDWSPNLPDTSRLVRSHREATQERGAMTPLADEVPPEAEADQPRPSVFDFEEEQPS